MLGLDLGLARIPFFDETAPGDRAGGRPRRGLRPVRAVRRRGPDGSRPRASSATTASAAIGAPLSDARTSGVRFAAECLAFANVPDEDALATLVPVPPYEAFVHNPYWKAGVARDAGSGWDFDDLRDDYLKLVFGVDPDGIRRYDHDRYLELSRAVTGEVMAHVFGEWRRAGSPSGGGMILWLRDLVAGAGYGVVDHRGRPKAAYHHLRRILAPTAVWLVDEGIGGVVAHVANDGPAPLAARLRVSLFTDLEIPVGEASEVLELPPHGGARAEHRRDARPLRRRLVGVSVRAAGAGRDRRDARARSMSGAGATEVLSQAFHFPAGRPLAQETGRPTCGLTATSVDRGGRHDPGRDHQPPSGVWRPDPRRRLRAERRRLLGRAVGRSDSDPRRRSSPGARFGGGQLTALNLAGRVVIRGPESGA